MKKFLAFISTVSMGLLAALPAFAEETAAAASGSKGNGIFALAFAMGIASGLGALAQSNAAKAALEGIARNPQATSKVQTAMIISLAMMESLVIFAFLFTIVFKGAI
jgi:F-type H+-transporting ATPase subunit c